jgi:hypothetical protein
LIYDEKEDDEVFARVCTVKDGIVRTTGDCDGDHTDSPLSFVVGSVVKLHHKDCAHAKIERLRQTHAQLQNADDAWSNVTRCYEIEREIYNLEHPVEDEDEDDDFEWPEEIDG